MPKEGRRTQPECTSNHDESSAEETLLLVQEKNNKLQSESQSPGCNVPGELLFDIFTRLPVKSLTRFSSVSKSWLSLITSPEFIKTHLKNCKKNVENKHPRRVFLTAEKEDEEYGGWSWLKLCECSHDVVVSKASSEEIEVTYGLIINPSVKIIYTSVYNRIMNSYDGLVLIVGDEEDLFLCNPATRKYRKLPDCGMEKERENCFLITQSYSIGYDECNDDYVVLGLALVVCGLKDYDTLAKIYSGKRDSWKKLEDFTYNVRDEGCYFLNGKFHFTASVAADNDLVIAKRKIVSLDVANNVCEEIKPPKECSPFYYWALGTLLGYLSLTLFTGSHVELFVMEEYGVRESWTKIAVVPPRRDPSGECFRRALALSKDGRVLFLTRPRAMLGVYDPDQNSFGYPSFNNLKEIHWENLYVQSLVSP